MDLPRVVIVGCGLIGGSFALALRAARPDTHIAVLDLPERLPAVRAAGVADEVAAVNDGAALLADASLVVLASPVEAILAALPAIAPHLRPGALVTDVGSTKSAVVRRAREVLPAGVAFIGGHPVAGSEQSGIEAADPLLFDGRVYLLCPASDTPSDALLKIIALAEALRAVPVTIEAEEHDRLMAAISHLPQLLAIALMDSALAIDRRHQMLDKAAGRAFLDLTRIAASDYKMWEGILRTNRTAIAAAFDNFIASLTRVRDALEGDRLAALWEKVSDRRRRLTADAVPPRRRTELRRAIDRCDEQIVKALGTRRRLARQVGRLKAVEGAPIYDPDRERDVLAKRRDWAASFGLPPDFVGALFRLILEDSKKAQAEKG